MKFDVVIVDEVAPYYYDAGLLELKALGGVEQAVIRIAEGLADLGVKVAVIQRRCDIEIAYSAYYLPWDWTQKIQPAVAIHVRSISSLGLFPKAKNYVWMHDLSQPFLSKWEQPLREVNATVLAVSDWHVSNLKEHLTYDKVKRLYCPVDDLCYTHGASSFNPNQLIWLSSPHKGLSEALDVFAELREKSPKAELVVLNPGYLNVKPVETKGVNYIGSVSRAELRKLAAESLCLFYPTQFKETFGMVAAECEALGTPVATYKVAALAESVGMSGHRKDEADLIDTILTWQKKRPVISGQERFRIFNAIKAWAKELFSKS